MAEFTEFMWGTSMVKRDLESVVDRAEMRLPSTNAAMEAFKNLVLALPNAGALVTDEEFLMRFLKARKMIVEDAFELYEAYYRFMSSNPEIFHNNTINNPQIREAIEDGLPGVLESPDNRGRRILVLFANQWDPNRYQLSTIHKAFYVTLDLLLDDLIVQERGVILIIDWSQFSLSQAKKLFTTSFRLIVNGLEYCFPVRFKAIHFIGQPWYIEIIMSLLKPFLRETSRNKIQIHGNNLSTLHQQLSKETLPSELGGEKGPYQSSKWIENLVAADERMSKRTYVNNSGQHL